MIEKEKSNIEFVFPNGKQTTATIMYQFEGKNGL